mmetsp:Transcript_7005/g.20340  ORF Transcript_7005/g.20340 Transcript_7005/m.20340 type:complete len:85 (+) Transcript_7005:32-286(+)
MGIEMVLSSAYQHGIIMETNRCNAMHCTALQRYSVAVGGRVVSERRRGRERERSNTRRDAFDRKVRTDDDNGSGSSVATKTVSP